MVVSFDALQSRAKRKTRTIDRSAENTSSPSIAGYEATARCTKGVLAANAFLTVQKTYTKGVIQTCEVPAK